MREKIIGILGGMGPEATADLFRRIIAATLVKRDQDHFRVIIDSNPKIPDRTEAIRGQGLSPLPEMIKTARNLEKAGASFIVVPCNTAHHYFEELRRSVSIPFLDMIELTGQEMRRSFPLVRKIGLIGTTGTMEAKIYDRVFNSLSVDVVYPSEDIQTKVMKAIYNVKAGAISKAKGVISAAASHLVDKGAEVIVCGCTEVSLAIGSDDCSVPVVDPLQILAQTAVAVASGRTTCVP